MRLYHILNYRHDLHRKCYPKVLHSILRTLVNQLLSADEDDDALLNTNHRHATPRWFTTTPPPPECVMNPAGPVQEGHREHLLMKMNFPKLEHKRAETAKCLFGWREPEEKRGQSARGSMDANLSQREI